MGYLSPRGATPEHSRRAGLTTCLLAARSCISVSYVATIHISVPADAEYVGLVRSTSAHVAAQCELTMDQIEDLRLAVNEAFAFLVEPDSTSRIEIAFTVDGGTLSITLCGSPSAKDPDRGSFGWTVLTALVNAVTSHRTSDGNLVIQLTALAGVSA